MIVAIQCAGSKQSGAGCLRGADGRSVLFVEHPPGLGQRDLFSS